MNKSIVFYDKAVKINEIGYNTYVPEGFNITSDKLEKMKNEFQYVNFVQHTSELWAKGRQNVAFRVVSSDFINTGVEIYMSEKSEYGVQKIELLYGEKWTEGTTEAITIVDLDTAKLVFGRENVVGEILTTNHGDLRIIGVVSNTIERQQDIDEAIKHGETYISEYLYQTYCYVPHEYYKILDLPAYNNDVIICDDEMTAKEIKHRLMEIFNIPQEVKTIFIVRDDVVSKFTPQMNFISIIIIGISSIFLMLGILNLALHKVKNRKNQLKINNNT